MAARLSSSHEILYRHLASRCAKRCRAESRASRESDVDVDAAPLCDASLPTSSSPSPSSSLASFPYVLIFVKVATIDFLGFKGPLRDVPWVSRSDGDDALAFKLFRTLLRFQNLLAQRLRSRHMHIPTLRAASCLLGNALRGVGRDVWHHPDFDIERLPLAAALAASLYVQRLPSARIDELARSLTESDLRAESADLIRVVSCCVGCGAEDADFCCGKCGAAYCSRACQKEDMHGVHGSHGTLCDAWSTAVLLAGAARVEEHLRGPAWTVGSEEERRMHHIVVPPLEGETDAPR